MMQYIKPKLPRTFGESLTAARVAEIHATFDRCERENQAAYQEAQRQHTQMIALAKSIYGDSSKQVKYLRNAGVPKPPALKAERKRVQKAYDDLQERIRQREYRRDYIARRDATAEQLEAIGYEPGVHFSSTAPITFARRHTVTAPDGSLLPALPSGEDEPHP